MTAIAVTHDQTEANALADRIAVMEGGVLQQMASPAELKARPANLFVATFVGEPPMNVFDAVVVPGTIGGPVLRIEGQDGAPGFDVGLPAGLDRSAASRLTPGRRVVVGIRPHEVKIGDRGHEAEVVSVQWLGDQTHVACLVAGRLTVAVVFDRLGLVRGSRVPLAIAAEAVHVFDRDSGRALVHGLEGAP